MKLQLKVAQILCSSRNLSTVGNIHQLQKRIDSTEPIEMKYSYYLLADFEGTCTADSSFDYPSEIIEFPVILFDKDMVEIDRFHEYVRPTLHPILSPFCIELTGISQSTVENASVFSDVFDRFQTWLKTKVPEPLEDHCVFVTDGPWDLRDFIQKELVYHCVSRPEYMKRVIDVRKWFLGHTSKPSGNIVQMLSHFNLTFEGHLHSGLDDAYNLSRVFDALLKDGCVVNHLSNVHNKTKHSNWIHLRK